MDRQPTYYRGFGTIHDFKASMVAVETYPPRIREDNCTIVLTEFLLNFQFFLNFQLSLAGYSTEPFHIIDYHYIGTSAI